MQTVTKNKINDKILILGASGFVGSHLLKRLLQKGHCVRVLTRDPSKIKSKSKKLEIVQGDLNDKKTIRHLFENIDCIFYLVHAMESTLDYEQIERKQARNVASLLKKNQKCIYLSGLGVGKLSKHLRSRQNVGKILQKSEAKIIEMRASIIIGKGSLSFELIKAIVQKFPFILQSEWALAPCQPLALADLLTYFEQSITKKFRQNKIFELGGPQVVRYADLLILCAALQNLKRPIISIENFPKRYVLTVMRVFLSEFYEVGHKLLGSIEIPTVASKEIDLFYPPAKTSLKQAIKKAL